MSPNNQLEEPIVVNAEMDVLPPKKSFPMPGFCFQWCLPPANATELEHEDEEPTTREAAVKAEISANEETSTKKHPPVIVTRDLGDLDDDIPEVNSLSSGEDSPQNEKDAKMTFALASPRQNMENASKLLMQLCQILLSMMFLDRMVPKKKSSAKTSSSSSNSEDVDIEPIPDVPQVAVAAT